MSNIERNILRRKRRKTNKGNMLKMQCFNVNRFIHLSDINTCREITKKPILSNEPIKRVPYNCEDVIKIAFDTKCGNAEADFVHRFITGTLCSKTRNDNVIFCNAGNDVCQIPSTLQTVRRLELVATLTINSDNVKDYFVRIISESSLIIIKDVNKMALIPVKNNTSSVCYIDIRREYIMMKIILYKLNSLCKQFKNTLATMCKKLAAATKVEDGNAPALMLQNWYFQNISQGYLLNYLLNSCAIVTLFLMRKTYFVIIKNPYPNLELKICLQCLKSKIYIALITTAVSDLSYDSLNWNRHHYIKWVECVETKPPMDWYAQQTKKFYERDIDSVKFVNRPITPEEGEIAESDLNIIRSTIVNNVYSSTTDFTVAEKKSVALFYTYWSEDPSLKNLQACYKNTKSYYTMRFKNSLRNNIRRAGFTSIFREYGSRFSPSCNDFESQGFMLRAQTLRDHCLSGITSKNCTMFFKCFGESLVSTLFKILI